MMVVSFFFAHWRQRQTQPTMHAMRPKMAPTAIPATMPVLTYTNAHQFHANATANASNKPKGKACLAPAAVVVTAAVQFPVTVISACEDTVALK